MNDIKNNNSHKEDPPQNPEAEGAVLGSILLRPSILTDIQGVLSPEDFFQKDNQEIYRALVSLFQDGEDFESDPIIVVDRLAKQAGDSRQEWSKKLLNIEVPTSAHYKSYTRQVREAAVTRGILSVVEKIRGQARGQAEVERLVQDLRDLTAEIDLVGLQDPVPFDIEEVFKLIKESPEGMKSGYRGLDKFIEFCPSELIVIAARPRHGKTTLAINLYLNMIEKYSDLPFVFFSHEMNMEQVLIKMIGARTGESYKGIKNNIREEMFNKSQGKAMDQFREYSRGRRLYIVNEPRWGVDRIVSYCRGVKANCEGIGAVFVDYIGLVADREAGDRESTEQRYSRVVNSLRIASQELNCPIIALSQMSREGVKGKTPKARYPRLDQLRYSGRIEQEAATVLAIYNKTEDEKREMDEAEMDDNYGAIEGTAELRLFNLKSRFGPGNKPLPFQMIQGNKIEEL